MAVELKVPSVGESVTEVQVGGWLVQPGQRVERDQSVVVIETDKASMEIPAPIAGALTQVLKPSGSKVKPGDVLGLMEEGAASSKPAAAPPRAAAATTAAAAPPQSARAAAAQAGSNPAAAPKVMPAAERLLAEHRLNPADVPATGPGGRLLKEDVQRAISGKSAAAPPATPRSPSPPPSRAAAPSPPPPLQPTPQAPRPAASPSSDLRHRSTESIPMSPLRKTIAGRLVESQHTAALLTTFNEVDMHAVVALRRDHGDAFLMKHGVKLGFMSFFVKAVVDAVAEVPAVNARIGTGPDGAPESIVYHHHCDVGVAVGGGKGLVVPVIRDAERLSFADVERRIADFATRAQANQLALEELTGGTFTISNGGVYGSLLSTPIVNPPQSGVLGLHAIQERPVARDGQVVVRPMMYVALTYDHRLVDGREAVTFLKRVKECVESPARILLEI